MVPDTPLPNCAVYWMLLVPVALSSPGRKNDVVLPRKLCQGVAKADADFAEGEAGELQEQHFDADVAAAGRVKHGRRRARRRARPGCWCFRRTS